MIETINIFGRSASLYFICWTVGMIAAFAVGMSVRKKYGLSDAKAVIYISLDMLIGSFLFGFARIGCIFPGCCHGYPSSWGLYSNEAGTVCFPIQIIEIIVSFILALIMWNMHSKERFQGKLYPWFLVLFGSTRFVLEFLRDNQKLFWGISELALHALSCFIVGMILLTLSKKRRSTCE